MAAIGPMITAGLRGVSIPVNSVKNALIIESVE